jgi:hypothetical protein
MNIRKFVLASLAGSIAMWLLAGLWHGVIMARFYATQTDATHEGTGIIFIAYLVLGGLMAYMYQRVYRGGRPVAEGLRFGILIGLLWVFPHELAMAGAHGEPLAYVFKNAAWHMAEQGFGGIIIALVYGRGIAQEM